MGYLISPMEECNLVIDPEDLWQRILLQWPHAQREKPIPGETVLLRWTIEFGTRRLLGALFDKGDCVQAGDSPEEAAEFARWLRSIISAQYRLWLYDDTFNTSVELTSEMTKDQIVQKLR